jgi:hypothetical protein
MIDRVALREVRCLSWDEEGYELLYNADEGKEFESMQIYEMNVATSQIFDALHG